MVNSFFHRLSYSFGNEDWQTEQQALQISPDDRVLCVTGSGDRPLNLLTSPCKEMVAIDLNPIQNHLLELKSAAIKALSYEEYLHLIGAKEGLPRTQLFAQVLPMLSSKTAAYWRRNGKALEKGLLYGGAVERWCRLASRFVNTFAKSFVKTLEECQTVQEQRERLVPLWDKGAIKSLLRLFMHPAITRWIVKDPVLYTHAKESNPTSYLHERIRHYLCHYPAKQSPLLQLIVYGKVSPEDYPPYLTEEGTQQIRPHLPLLTPRTTSLLEILRGSADHSISRFSLSDVASYIDGNRYEEVLTEMVRVATPGARFCIRQCMTNRGIPPSLRDRITVDQELSDSLTKQDSCMVYSFLVGSIV